MLSLQIVFTFKGIITNNYLWNVGTCINHPEKLFRLKGFHLQENDYWYVEL